jgi:hypothetical protein
MKFTQQTTDGKNVQAAKSTHTTRERGLFYRIFDNAYAESTQCGILTFLHSQSPLFLHSDRATSRYEVAQLPPTRAVPKSHNVSVLFHTLSSWNHHFVLFGLLPAVRTYVASSGGRCFSVHELSILMMLRQTDVMDIAGVQSSVSMERQI